MTDQPAPGPAPASVPGPASVPYPLPQFRPGTTIPVDGWIHGDIQQRLQNATVRGGARADAERDAFIAQRFAAWQVYPVKVGRWRLKLYGADVPDIGGGSNDPISMVIFLLWLVYACLFAIVMLVAAPGKWVKAPTVVQILDPATGRPIAEHFIDWRSTRIDAGTLDDSSTLIFLGDPRVCGLVGQATTQGQVIIAGTAFNRQGKWRVKSEKWTSQYIEQNSARLISTPYKEYDSRRCGPWLQDSPERPTGGRTRWTRLKQPNR